MLRLRDLCMKDYNIKLPDDFYEYAWEIELKGCFEIDVQIAGNVYTFNFYDPIRLNQTVEDDLHSSQYFFYENMVILPRVNIENIKKFIEDVIDTPYILSFAIKR